MADRPAQRYPYCHAPHPDRRRRGDACGKQLAQGIPAEIEFIMISDDPPVEPDGSVWLPCPRRACGKWNRFRIVAP